MGTGQERAGGIEAGANPANNCRSLGGQASGPGLFGLPGNGSLFRRNPAGKAAPAPQGQADDTAQRIGGLTFRQRAARLPQVVAPVVTVVRAPSVPSIDELMAKRRHLAAAYASDMREAFPAHYDADEAAECGVPLLCAAELALAQD